MADIGIEIQGTPNAISSSTFKATINDSIDLLREYDSAISGVPRGSLAWYLSKLSMYPVVTIGFRAHLKPAKESRHVQDMSGLITNSFVSGLDTIEHRGATPPYLSVGGMEKVQHLASLIGKNGATGFRVSADAKAVNITSATVDNIGRLLPIKRTSIGSVEGLLEGINLHGRPRVIVYHAITHKAVTCDFEEPKHLATVMAALGKRVAVFGTLSKNSNGDTLRVDMERLKVFGETDEDHRFLSTDISGLADPGFANGVSTEEYLRSIRD